jgi:ribose/xylose/arabinose/galactoside ABC-type transport system permease subunit
MPAFIATMAVMYVLYGIAAIISGGFPVIGFPNWYSVIGAGNIMGLIPVPAVITLIMFFFTFTMMNHTKLGRSIYAVGGNIEAARLNGVNIKVVKSLTFIFVQFCGVLSGVMVSSQVMSGGFNFAKGWDFQAISCVVIGGTAFTGGKGRIWGTFIGLFFYGIVTNAMTLLNVNQYAQYVVRGILILVAVIINSFHKN